MSETLLRLGKLFSGVCPEPNLFWGKFLMRPQAFILPAAVPQWSRGSVDGYFVG